MEDTSHESTRSFSAASWKPASLRGVVLRASGGVSLEDSGRFTALSLECCPTWQFTPKKSQLRNPRLILVDIFPSFYLVWLIQKADTRLITFFSSAESYK